MSGKEKKLTPKQALFCREYLKDMNGKQAAIRAGYKENAAASTASENLTKPNVCAFLQSLMQERAEKVDVDAEWVLRRFVEVADRCMQAEPVMERAEDGTMVETGEYKFDSTGARGALDSIGKHLGMFTQKIDHSSSDGSMSPDNLTPEQRQRRIQELLDKSKAGK